jgi:hypothetical protein
MNSNWKTTTLGTVSFVAVLLNAVLKTLHGNLSTEDITILGAGTAASVGLVAAKDHDK